MNTWEALASVWLTRLNLSNEAGNQNILHFFLACSRTVPCIGGFTLFRTVKCCRTLGYFKVGTCCMICFNSHSFATNLKESYEILISFLCRWLLSRQAPEVQNHLHLRYTSLLFSPSSEWASSQATLLTVFIRFSVNKLSKLSKPVRSNCGDIQSKYSFFSVNKLPKLSKPIRSNCGDIQSKYSFSRIGAQLRHHALLRDMIFRLAANFSPCYLIEFTRVLRAPSSNNTISRDRHLPFLSNSDPINFSYYYWLVFARNYVSVEFR